jgi:hypothetical protein
MKSVPVLGTLLMLALVLLATVIVTDVEEGWLAAVDHSRSVAAPPHAAPLPVGMGSQDGRRCLDVAELRRIIREELAAQPTATTVARSPDSPGLDPAPPGEPRATRQLELVNRQVDDYIRAGAISEVQMADLQDEIARLDPAARREVLGKIARAMNSGALAGNL